MRTPAIFILLVFLASLSSPMQAASMAGMQNPAGVPLAAEFAPLIRWSQTAELNGVAYFLIPTEKKLERYSLTSRAWLAAINFSLTPSVFAVDESGIYVAFGQALSRFGLDGKNEFPFSPCASPVYDLQIYNQYLIVLLQSTPWLSLNKQTGSQVDTLIPANFLSGTRLLPDRDLLVGQSDSMQWASILLNPDGTFGDQFSRSSGAFSLTWRTFVLPGQNRVLDGAGQIFFANDLSYVRSIIDPVDAVAVFEDQYLVASKGALIGYDSADQKLGEYYPLKPAQAVFVSGSTIFSFFSRPDGIDVTLLPVSVIGLTGQKKIIDPEHVDFWPDAVALGSDETLYLLNRPGLSIFRWSVSQRRFLPSIPLNEPPQDMAYAPLANTLYLSYPNGKITRIQLSASEQEEPFAATPSHFNGYGLIACDEFLVSVTKENYEFFHYVFNMQGAQVARKGARVGSFDYAWNSANRRLYYLQEDSGPHWVVSEEIDSSGQVRNDLKNTEVVSSLPNLWVKPDGTTLVTGEGRAYDARTLALSPARTITAPVIGAAWLGSSLFAATPDAQGAGLLLSKYDGALQPVSSGHMEGKDARLFAVSEGLLVLNRLENWTVMTIYGDDLQESYHTPYYAFRFPMALSPGAYKEQYVDKFSDPSSGWAEYEDDQVKFGYVNGAYSIRTAQPGLYAAFAPMPRAENYEMEVDLIDITPSDEYGVILDVMGSGDRFILFGFSRWANRIVAYQYDGSTYQLSYDNFAYTNKIRLKILRTQNELRVEDRYGSTLMSNMYFELYPYVSRIGFYVSPRPDRPVAEARFDNLVFRPLEGRIAPALKTLPQGNAGTGSPAAGEIVILPSSEMDRIGGSR